jgi:hypothetical protein
VQAALRLILGQLGGVLGLLVFKRHRMDDAFDITSDSLASGFFGEFRERAGRRHEYVNQLAPHGCGNSPKGTERNAVFGFGLFKLLDRLSRYPHFLADLALAKAERLAH